MFSARSCAQCSVLDQEQIVFASGLTNSLHAANGQTGRKELFCLLFRLWNKNKYFALCTFYRLGWIFFFAERQRYWRSNDIIRQLMTWTSAPTLLNNRLMWPKIYYDSSGILMISNRKWQNQYWALHRKFSHNVNHVLQNQPPTKLFSTLLTGKQRIWHCQHRDVKWVLVVWMWFLFVIGRVAPRCA